MNCLAKSKKINRNEINVIDFIHIEIRIDLIQNEFQKWYETYKNWIVILDYARCEEPGRHSSFKIEMAETTIASLRRFLTHMIFFL